MPNPNIAKDSPTTFKPGQSGNPNGRPKGAVSLVTKVREALDRIHEGTETRYDELLIQSTLKDAIKTDGQSRRMIFQYLEGMPIQRTDLTTKGDKIVFIPSEIANKNEIETTSQPEPNSEGQAQV